MGKKKEKDRRLLEFERNAAPSLCRGGRDGELKGRGGNGTGRLVGSLILFGKSRGNSHKIRR